MPLVLILHGKHDSEDPDGRFYEGFSFLADSLARRGWTAAAWGLQ